MKTIDNIIVHISDSSFGSAREIRKWHTEKGWKDIVSALRLVGYDYVISIEHEDPLMSIEEGLSKSIALLADVVMKEKPGQMFWA